MKISRENFALKFRKFVESAKISFVFPSEKVTSSLTNAVKRAAKEGQPHEREGHEGQRARPAPREPHPLRELGGVGAGVGLGEAKHDEELNQAPQEADAGHGAAEGRGGRGGAARRFQVAVPVLKRRHVYRPIATKYLYLLPKFARQMFMICPHGLMDKAPPS